MKRVLLFIGLLAATVVARADSITIGLATLATSPGPGYTNIVHPHWVVARPDDFGMMFGFSDEPNNFAYLLLPNAKVVTFKQDFLIPAHPDWPWMGRNSDSAWRGLNGNEDRNNPFPFFDLQRTDTSLGLHHAGEMHDVSPVPEPSTFLMLGTGVCTLIAAARRRLRR